MSVFSSLHWCFLAASHSLLQQPAPAGYWARRVFAMSGLRSLWHLWPRLPLLHLLLCSTALGAHVHSSDSSDSSGPLLRREREPPCRPLCEPLCPEASRTAAPCLPTAASRPFSVMTVHLVNQNSSTKQPRPRLPGLTKPGRLGRRTLGGVSEGSRDR